tara:strand:- start:2061 stop:2321 length:261 start_codon:yes stop_codon:yes gene_type:complete
LIGIVPFALEKRLTERKGQNAVTENTGDSMTEEQFEWFCIVGGMCADGLKWVEAMALCRTTMEMPDDIYEWMIERKKAIAAKKAAA